MAAVLLLVGKHLEQPEIVQQMLDVQLTPCKPQYNYAPEVRQCRSAKAARCALLVRDTCTVCRLLHWYWCYRHTTNSIFSPVWRSYSLCSVMQEPLLFSKCCYHNLTFRTSDKNRLQTLQAVESMADKHRIGCNVYMQVAEKLNLESCQPFQDLKRSMHVAPVPHVKLLQRITEPSLPERIGSLANVKLNSQKPELQ